MNPKKRRFREQGTRVGSVKEPGRNTWSISECQPSRKAARENKHVVLGSKPGSAAS